MARGGPEGQKAALLGLAFIVAAAGISGLPGAEDLDDLIDTLMQSLGYEWSTELERRKIVQAVLGKTLGDLALYGMSAVMPVDVHGRFSMGNIIPATDLFKPSNSHKLESAAELAGPMGAIAAAYMAGLDGLQSGGGLSAFKGAMPKAIKDAWTGIEMANTGQYRDTRGRMTTEVDWLDAIIKGIGFQPSQVAKDGRSAGPMYDRVAYVKEVRNRIADRWAKAIRDGEPNAYANAMEAKNAWNAKNPNAPIEITPQQVKARLRELNSARDARLLKTAPKALRDEMAQELADD